MKNKKQEFLKDIGKRCKKFRIEKLQVKQEYVAKQLNMSQQSISNFENGKNDNMHILAWYIEWGFVL